MEEESSRKEKKKKEMATNPPAEQGVPQAAASFLPDELVVQILSRLPARSVHRFKCVSPSWRKLIVDPAHRDKLRHPLAGFFYGTYRRATPFQFANFSSGAAPPVDPSLPFLPRPPDQHLYVDLLDACNGLLLCRCYRAPSVDVDEDEDEDDDDEVDQYYMVCNPATEKWVDLPPEPQPDTSRITPRLAFDPVVSSHFHVLAFEESDGAKFITGVKIYSSQTGAWKHTDSGLVEKISLFSGEPSVFFGGLLHLLGTRYPVNINSDSLLVAVDVEGRAWKTIRMPSNGLGFDKIGLSQGCLHYASTPLISDDNMKTATRKEKKENEEDTSLTSKITVWCLKGYDNEEWVLKHSVSIDKLFAIYGVKFKVAAIHPDCDTIFLDSCETDVLALYDLQLQRFGRVLNLKKDKTPLLVPYVPFFSKSDADGQ